MNNTQRGEKINLMISRRCKRINDKGPTLYMEWSINEHGECQTEVNAKGHYGHIHGKVDVSVTCTDPLSFRKATENAVGALLFKLMCMGLLISKESDVLVLIAERNEIMLEFGNITNATDNAFPWEHNGFLGKRA